MAARYGDNQRHLSLLVASLQAPLGQFGREPLLVFQHAHPMFSRLGLIHWRSPMLTASLGPFAHRSSLWLGYRRIGARLPALHGQFKGLLLTFVA